MELEYESVTGFRTHGNGFQVTTDCALRECRALVLATGGTAPHPGPARGGGAGGQGVSYCAVCDGPFYAGKAGGGGGGRGHRPPGRPVPVRNLLQVTLIHRREEFRGARRLVEQVLARDNIACEMDSTVEELLTREGGLSA